ncbi:MAG TPA: wax ester/triacylglycerol synthase domain-containing protein [Candidatus Dormibacteraeota bacterium]|nr:wax ester/triacylglycerol synthase domain-containing protein [Candidatus Dormibacteraeota bacterium]
MRSGERLTAVEASFIALEQPRLPMHVGALTLFESGRRPVTMRELRRHVAARLGRVGSFHEILRTSPAGWPEWVPSNRIRPSAHFFHHVLTPPGDESQVRRLCGEIHEDMLDRNIPLWEVHLIDGISGGRQGLLVKTHHAITDGLAGMQIAQLLFDPAPGAARPQPPVMRFAQLNTGQSIWSALQGLVGLAFNVAGGPLPVHGPFDGPGSGQRAFGMATLSLPAIKRIKRQLGVRVDDVLTAMITAGLRRYLSDIEYPDTPRALRALLPVSTRGSVRAASPRNDVSAIFIDLPMDIDDMPTLVCHIAEAKATLRTAHATEGSAMAVQAAGLLPAPVHAALLRAVSGFRFANLVLSDVPGPDQALFFLGRRIDACYPLMPLGRSVGLSIASVGMGDAIGVGLTADPMVVPDVQSIALAIEHAAKAFEGAVPRPARHRAA